MRSKRPDLLSEHPDKGGPIASKPPGDFFASMRRGLRLRLFVFSFRSCLSLSHSLTLSHLLSHLPPLPFDYGAFRKEEALAGGIQVGRLFRAFCERYERILGKGQDRYSFSSTSADAPSKAESRSIDPAPIQSRSIDLTPKSQRTRGYWSRSGFANMKRHFDDVARAHGFDAKNAEQWYSVPLKEVIAAGVITMHIGAPKYLNA